MKKINTYICLLLLAGSLAINATENNVVTEDYSKMSADELGKALVAAVQWKNQDAVTKLIEAGASVDQEVRYWETQGDCDWDVSQPILVYAASRGYATIVRELLKASPKIEAVNRAFVCAASRNDANMVSDLLKANPEIDAVKEAVIGVAKEGCADMVRDLLGIISDADSVSEKYLNKIKNFIRAIAHVNFASKKFLDEALMGAVINFMDPSSCAKGSPKNYLDIIQLLVQEGADVNYEDHFGNTLVIKMLRKNLRKEALKKSQAEIIQLLLKAGADINRTNKARESALTHAINNNDLDAVLMLLQVPGIDLNLTDNDGNTPLMLAIYSIRRSYRAGNTQEYNDCVNSQEIVKKLAETPGIDSYIANKKGETAITLFKRLSN